MKCKVLVVALLFLVCDIAFAEYVRVSQADTTPGSEIPFTTQGFVKIFDKSGNSAASLYDYNGDCSVSYSGTSAGGLFDAEHNATVLAVVKTADGTALFVVHDAPYQSGLCPYTTLDNSGGKAWTQFDLYFDGDGMDCLVEDGPPSENGDSYSGCGSSSVLIAQEWVSTATDGVVLGSLDGPWRLEMWWDPVGGPCCSSNTHVTVKGADGNHITPLPKGGYHPIRLDFVLNLDIDIKPGSDPNCFNINGHGVIPVALLGSAEFDVTLIDISTLDFAGLTVRVRGNKGPLCSFEDSNGDGFTDVVCQFEDDASAWTAGDSMAEIWGELTDTTPFYGEDAICIRP